MGAVTLAHALEGSSQLDLRAELDLHRRAGKLNASYLDGHVEPHAIEASDLQEVYLSSD